jgi:hypothetical protein
VKTDDGNYKISLYPQGLLTDESIAVNLKKLQISFSRQTPEFFNILAERIVANGFTDEKLKDAVNYVIDNFQYKELNISEIVRYDLCAKLYTGEEYMNFQMKGMKPSDFEKRKVDGINYVVKKSDLRR